MNMESPLQFCNKVINNPYNWNNIKSMQITLPPSKFQIDKMKKKIKVKVRVKPTHFASTRMMATTYTFMVTYETSLVCKSRWIAHMCC
jgi:hypothetical protein